MTGRPTDTLNLALIEELLDLAPADCTWQHLATRLHMKPDSVRKILERANRPDLIQRIQANSPDFADRQRSSRGRWIGPATVATSNSIHQPCPEPGCGGTRPQPGWIQLRQAGRGTQTPTPLWFCSWRCAASACYRAELHPTTPLVPADETRTSA